MKENIADESIKIIDYIKKYEQFINKVAFNVIKKCPKLEHEDVKQQLFLALFQSNINYDQEKKTKNSTYYSQILINSSFNIIRKYWQPKNKVYAESVSLDAYIDDLECTNTFLSMVSESEDSYLNPQTYVNMVELQEFVDVVITKFNKKEKKIFDYYINGMNVSDIAKKTKISKKSVYNTLTAIKEKVKKYYY